MTNLNEWYFNIGFSLGGLTIHVYEMFVVLQVLISTTFTGCLRISLKLGMQYTI